MSRRKHHSENAAARPLLIYDLRKSERVLCFDWDCCTFFASAAQAHGANLDIGFFENVGGLADCARDGDGPSNLDYVAHILKERLKMCVMIFGIDPAKCMNMKVSRFRFWIPHLFAHRLGSMPTDQLVALAVETMETIVGASEATPLEDMLLREDDPAVLQHYDRLLRAVESKKNGQSKPAKKDTGAWATKHFDELTRQGLQWWDMRGPTKVAFDLFPGLHALSPRELDVLACLGVSYPEAVNRTIDVSQTWGFSKIRTESMGCTVPSMKEYLTGRCRVSLGIESMHFQGLHYGRNHIKLRQYSDAFLQDVAGNAFEVRKMPCPCRKSFCLSRLDISSSRRESKLRVRARARFLS